MVVERYMSLSAHEPLSSGLAIERDIFGLGGDWAPDQTNRFRVSSQESANVQNIEAIVGISLPIVPVY